MALPGAYVVLLIRSAKVCGGQVISDSSIGFLVAD